MRYDLPPALTDVADRQRGVITRDQARSAGMTPPRSGRRCSGQAAGPCSLPHRGRTRPAHRPSLFAPSRLPPRTRIEETVLDLADSSRDLWDAIGWVTAGLGRRLTTQDLLRTALKQRSRMRWRTDLEAVLGPDLAGIHSALEYRYHRCVEVPHRLPRPLRQARGRRSDVSEYRDMLYEEYMLAVELDGQVAHPGDARWQDIKRDNAAAAAGIITLRFGYRDVAMRPCQVAEDVARVLRLRGWTGSPRRCSPACPAGR